MNTFLLILIMLFLIMVGIGFTIEGYTTLRPEDKKWFRVIAIFVLSPYLIGLTIAVHLRRNP